MSDQSQSRQQKTTKHYQIMIETKGYLTHKYCSWYSDFSRRLIDNFARDGTLQFSKIGASEKIPFSEFDAFMPGGSAEWLSADETAELIGRTKRQLEGMRRRGEGPAWKKFGAKLLRYSRSSVVAYNQAASTTNQSK